MIDYNTYYDKMLDIRAIQDANSYHKKELLEKGLKTAILEKQVFKKVEEIKKPDYFFCYICKDTKDLIDDKGLTICRSCRRR